ncbi:MAG: (2Fe-2S)-binding protein [Pseudomonadota bacterium]
MYVCICKQVTERHIHEAISNGACSFKEIRNQLGVATQCGQCKSHARKCMRECSNQCADSFNHNSNSIPLAVTTA